MFRLHESAIPADFHFPVDLQALGYAINDHDQIRSVKNPEQEFNFFISKNERMNVVQREAFNTCIRTIVQSRLLSSSVLTTTPLPLGTSPPEPHIPIYTSTNLHTCTRLIIYIGESWQDLGVFAWRTIGQDTIASGSIIDFVHSVQRSPDRPGIIVANPGQLLWYRGGQRAVTQATWQALPRKWAVSPAMEIDEVRNRVVGNHSPAEHVAYVFDEVVTKMARKDVKIDVIGMGDGAREVVGCLKHNWEKWAGKVQAVAVGTAFVWQGDEVGEGKFKEFWGDRCRAYIQSTEPLDTPLEGRKEFGCNCYSAGTGEVLELVMPSAWKSMLGFFQLLNDVPGYRELAVDEGLNEVLNEEMNGNIEAAHPN
ncbi:MAG: hypothetical protein Q9222_001865 [Ikaeria aurantiellina]